MVHNSRLGNMILEPGNVRSERGFEGSIVLADHSFVG